MLYTRFETAIVVDTLGGIVPAPTLRVIQDCYDEEGRFYHDFDHAVEVLSWIDRASEEIPEQELEPYNFQELRLAGLFHDIVYTTEGSPVNEQQSCDLMRELLAEVIPDEILDRVCELIMLTAQHGKLEAGDVSLAGSLLLDSDIANIGEPHWEVFVYNNTNVTKELSFKYTDEQLEVVRKAFLGGLLAKKSIYLSDFFRVRREDQARRNLSRLLAGISESKSTS